MSNEKGFIKEGHVTLLKTKGIELSENSESGLTEALEKHAAAIFSILQDELRNTFPSMTFNTAEHYRNEEPNQEKAAHYTKFAATSLERARHWISVSERFLDLNSEASPERTALEKALESFKEEIPNWEARLKKLQE